MNIRQGSFVSTVNGRSGFVISADFKNKIVIVANAKTGTVFSESFKNIKLRKKKSYAFSS